MKDLIVIGAGPAGYTAAIRAAQLGADVLVFEEADRPGGICLNWGCIPTKTLLHIAQKYRRANEADKYGLKFNSPEVNWEKMIDHSRKVVRKLAGGVRGLFKKNGVDYINDRARVVTGGTVETEAEESYRAEKILLAHGATSRTFPDMKPNGDRIMSHRDALTLSRKPESMIIVGGGAIGLEFGDFYNTFGTEVTVLEMQEQLLPGEDKEIATRLEKNLRKSGLDIQTSTAVEKVRQINETVKVHIENGNCLEADYALVALGVAPGNDEICAASLEPATTGEGWLEVNEEYETSVAGVYAAGDCIGPPWLAHAASHEGTRMVEMAFGDETRPVNYASIPACTYTAPQVASAGLTEEESRKKYEKIEIGKFPFRALGRTIATDEQEGFAKLIFAGDSQQLVGAHLLGAQASELIASLVLGINMGITPDNIIDSVFAHPTRSEIIHEAALSSYGRPIHG